MTIKPLYLTDENGKRTAVQFSIEDYEEMMEDIDDLMAIADSKGEPRYSLEEVKANLKKHGLL